ncbi:hypothetical protein FJZ36_11150 [Candidatus Poribacteria bacterium]|nr:hypothetical protein [Candidatus Poribacteria bacterium]
MNATVQTLAGAREWQRVHELHAPKVGEPAPDFELSEPDGTQPVRLSALCPTRPVALVFGSFT